MKKYLTIFSFLIISFFMGSMVAHGDDGIIIYVNTEPSVVTSNQVSNITSFTATSGGEVIADGGSPLGPLEVTERGIVWSMEGDGDPTLTSNVGKRVSGSGMGAFTSNLDNLSADTIYYVRAYATNSIGTSYGNRVDFTTSPGICSYPTQDVVVACDPRAGYYVESGEVIRTQIKSPYPSCAFPLPPVTVDNSTYKSDNCIYKPIFLPTLTTNTVTSIEKTTAVTGGNVTSDGGSPILARGMVLFKSEPSPYRYPSVSDNSIITTDGAGLGSFTTNLTGLEPGYFYLGRAYATNILGTEYGTMVYFWTPRYDLPTPGATDVSNIYTSNNSIYITVKSGLISNGGDPDTKVGFYVGSDSNNVTSNRIECFPDTYCSFNTGQVANKIFYIKSFAKNARGEVIGEITTINSYLPSVSVYNNDIFDITKNSAEAYGFISSEGGTPVTQSGLVWCTNEYNAYFDQCADEDGYQTTNGWQVGGPWPTGGTIMSDLKPDTTYYVRAYAVNSIGTKYSTMVSFKTKPIMSGTLTSASETCTIKTTGNSCNYYDGNVVKLDWTIKNPEGNKTAITSDGFYSEFSNIPDYGSINATVYYGSRNFYLYNNAQELANTTVTAQCDLANGYKWDSTVNHCILNSTGSLSSNISACTIEAGYSSCPVNLTWATQYPVGTSAITASATTNPDYPEINYSLNSGTRSFDVPYNNRTFFLYNNTKELAQTTVYSDCAYGSYWDPDLNICKKNQYIVYTSVQVNGIANVLGGSITPENAYVDYNEKTTFNIMPYMGYSLPLLGVTGCGGTLVGNTYTTGNITDDCTVTANFKPIMSGTLTSPSETCTITTTGYACNNVKLDWTIKNPEGNKTAITSDGFYSEVSTSLITPQSGSINATVYYGSRNFYLYNNTQELANTTVTAQCDLANGYIWGGPTVNHCILSSRHIYTMVYTDGEITGDDDSGGIIDPISKDITYGTSTTFTVTTKNNIYKIDSVTGCGGTLVGNTYTTGVIKEDCDINVYFKTMTGDITPDAPSCEIGLDKNSCDVNLSWIITNPIGITTAITSQGMEDYDSGAVSGSTNVPFTVIHGLVGPGSKIFYLYNNAALLDQVTATAECDENTVWNGTVCARSAGTITASNCEIEEDENSCDVNLTWETVHPTVPESEVTTPSNISVAKGNNGSTTYPVECTGTGSPSECERTFYLYNGGDPELDQVTAKASCSSINKWNANDQVCRYQSPILTLSATSCSPIPLGGTTCHIDINWDTEYSEETSVLKVNGVEITRANRGINYDYVIKPGTHTFSLSNKETTVYAYSTIKCADFTHWSDVDDKCIIDAPDDKNITFTAKPSIILPKKSSTLSWDASYVVDASKPGNTCSLGDGIGSKNVSPVGTEIVKPEETTTYTLTCTNTSGSKDKPLLIKVVTLTVQEQ
jgi:hypothetical protein